MSDIIIAEVWSSVMTRIRNRQTVISVGTDGDRINIRNRVTILLCTNGASRRQMRHFIIIYINIDILYEFFLKKA